MDRIVALDPGGTTGYAIRYENGKIDVDQYQTNHPEGLLELYEVIKYEWPNVIVMERFQFRYGGGRAKVVLTPVEVIGVVKLLVAELNRNEVPIKLFEQTPSQGKGLWTDDKIQRLNLWTPNKRHAMDAMRHLLYYEVVTEKNRTRLEGLRPSDN